MAGVRVSPLTLLTVILSHLTRVASRLSQLLVAALQCLSLGRERGWVRVAQRLTEAAQRVAVQRLRLAKLTLITQQNGKVVHGRERGWVRVAQRLASRVAAQRLRLAQLA